MLLSIILGMYLGAWFSGTFQPIVSHVPFDFEENKWMMLWTDANKCTASEEFCLEWASNENLCEKFSIFRRLWPCVGVFLRCVTQHSHLHVCVLPAVVCSGFCQHWRQDCPIQRGEQSSTGDMIKHRIDHVKGRSMVLQIETVITLCKSR